MTKCQMAALPSSEVSDRVEENIEGNDLPNPTPFDYDSINDVFGENKEMCNSERLRALIKQVRIQWFITWTL